MILDVGWREKVTQDWRLFQERVKQLFRRSIQHMVFIDDVIGLLVLPGKEADIE